MNRIENLLERYFEGDTPAAEEAEIRRFFTAGEIPEHLAMYTPLFVYFENEIRQSKSGACGSGRELRLTATAASCPVAATGSADNRRKIHPPGRRRNRIRWLTGAAACAALLAGMFFLAPRPGKCPEEGNYAIINGRCYTDRETVRSTALKTLREVSTGGSEFPDGNAPEANRIIESQLKEFDFLFNE
jgi:hypothetical protein